MKNRKNLAKDNPIFNHLFTNNKKRNSDSHNSKKREKNLKEDIINVPKRRKRH